MRPIPIAALLALVLAACAPPVTRPPEATPQAPVGFPEGRYLDLAAQGRPVFRVDGARSLVVVEVHRAGSLARVGHDHVIAAHGITGYIAPDEGRADLYARLEDLAVDEPDLRAAAKLDTHPSSEDIAGTRRNMLTGLDSAQYPFAAVHVSGVLGRDGETPLDVALAIHGVTQVRHVPVRTQRAGDELTATGRMTLKQTDFGMKPLSLLGGALQVQDEFELRFTIRARRVR
jgi:hypothetical protein